MWNNGPVVIYYLIHIKYNSHRYKLSFLASWTRFLLISDVILMYFLLLFINFFLCIFFMNCLNIKRHLNVNKYFSDLQFWNRSNTHYNSWSYLQLSNSRVLSNTSSQNTKSVTGENRSIIYFLRQRLPL